MPPVASPTPRVNDAEHVRQLQRLEDELTACNRRFRAVFDSGFQFVMLLDAEGAVLEINRAAQREFAAPDATLGHAKAWDCLWWNAHAEASARLRAAIERARIQSPFSYSDEFPGANNSGGPPVVLEVEVSRMADADGLADQFVVEARDVSSRRRSELAGHEIDSLTAMGRIAAKVAHEINNPLAGIQYAFLLIKDAIPPSHPQHKYVGAIEREIVRIAAVTRQLYETYRAEPETESLTSLANVIGDAITFMQHANRSTGVQIVTDLTRAPMLVRVSGAVLRHVMYNLVQNAMDASPEGATVTISAEMKDQLEIRVADSGPGVPVELRDRIFDPFFSTKDKRDGASGMGLGLYMVRRSVLAAGGRIRVEPGPAGGAVFIVTLPPQSGT